MPRWRAPAAAVLPAVEVAALRARVTVVGVTVPVLMKKYLSDEKPKQ